MSEAIDEPLVYQMGDEVKIRLSLTHDEQLTAVEVVYTHVEDRSYTFCLSGTPILDEGSSTVGKAKRSTVELSAVWDVAHAPGRYYALRSIYYTFAGHAMVDEPVATIHEVEWPVLALDVESGSTQITEVTPISEDTL